MRKGKLVEMAPTEEIFLTPKHPYTKALLSAVPVPDPDYEKNRKIIEYKEVDK
jgi:oligopeptide/dipeptide ABC transporter ATP-binding protein